MPRGCPSTETSYSCAAHVIYAAGWKEGESFEKQGLCPVLFSPLPIVLTQSLRWPFRERIQNGRMSYCYSFTSHCPLLLLCATILRWATFSCVCMCDNRGMSNGLWCEQKDSSRISLAAVYLWEFRAMAHNVAWWELVSAIIEWEEVSHIRCNSFNDIKVVSHVLSYDGMTKNFYGDDEDVSW